jgi:hypothetical protein
VSAPPAVIRIKPWAATVFAACVLLGGPAIVAASYLVRDLVHDQHQRQGIDRYVGTWSVHGSRLEVRLDLTGESVWNAGPCRSGNTSPMCTGREQIRFTVTSAYAVGTVNSVDYSDDEGNPAPDHDAGSEGPKPGNTFRLTVVASDVLEKVSDPPVRGANPYLCGPKASAEWKLKCNV